MLLPVRSSSPSNKSPKNNTKLRARLPRKSCHRWKHGGSTTHSQSTSRRCPLVCDEQPCPLMTAWNKGGSLKSRREWTASSDTRTLLLPGSALLKMTRVYYCWCTTTCSAPCLLNSQLCFFPADRQFSPCFACPAFARQAINSH